MTRSDIAREIDAHLDRVTELVAMLDTMDQDPDLEPCADDEPSLGWTTGGAWGRGNEEEAA